ncbi:hypothetical protein Poli38472_008641 [Pythium oligandrum]|uniref:SH2 domain-containing protein n=1 Tax=Pythium oligandrum TaxID=41045 RepID=A0A8K1FEM3_PYTOL|nr:hypothetical protein Poli38472_008641 [Pythium oligandrum]|eukprot:TMW55993.1 hypothetical protein Poli38472_008641 [Pythium oligandrum]
MRMATTTTVDAHDRGVFWWNERFGLVASDEVVFSTALWPALLNACRQELPKHEVFSMEELRVMAKYCIADSAWQHDTISQQDFLHFIARFGPLESSLAKVIECFTVHRELVSWFHGSMTRAEAECVLLSSQMDDGSFLVRFSESQPTRFTLSYVKVHTAPPHTGRREMRNVLIENIGKNGYVLTDSRNKAYSSIRAFIQRSSARLKYGVASKLARKCNQELVTVRSRQDLASNSYTAFSTESLGASSSSPNTSPAIPAQVARSALFDKSMPTIKLPPSNNQEEHLQANDNYSGFAFNTLLKTPSSPPKPSNPYLMESVNSSYSAFEPTAVVGVRNSPSQRSVAPSYGNQTPVADSDYSGFSSFMLTNSPSSKSPVTNQVVEDNNNEYASFESIMTKVSFSPSRARATSSSQASDEYGSFDSFTMDSVAKPSQRQHVLSQRQTAPPQDNNDYGNFMALGASVTGEPATSHGNLSRGPPSFMTASAEAYAAFANLPLTMNFVKPPPPPTSQPSPAEAPKSVTPAPPASAPAAFERPDNQEEHDAPPSTTVSALDELNAGMEFYKQQRLDDALLRFIHARELAQEIKDQVIEARALGNLGTVYLDKKNVDQAVTCYEQCLAITRSIKDVKRERTILNNLVLALMAKEDFVSAHKYCQVQLDMTVSEINRSKILSRMSLLREQVARATRQASARAVTPPY